MMGWKRVLRVMFVSLFIAGYGLSQSFFSPIAGYVPGSYSAKSMGLGFVSLASEGLPISLETNPSMIYGKERYVFAINMDIKRIFEKRSFPVIDPFGDFLADNIYVANKNYYMNCDMGIVYRPVRRISFGLNISSQDLGYFKYAEEVRGAVFGYYNRDPLVGYHRMENTCKVTVYSLGASMHVLRNLGFGVSVSAVSCRRVSYFYEIDAIEGLASKGNLAADRDIRVESGNCKNIGRKVNVGMTQAINKRLTIGVFYSSSYNVGIDNPPYLLYPDSGLGLPETFIDTSGVVSNIEYSFPASYGISVKYSPRNILPTRFYVEVCGGQWKKFRMSVVHNDSSIGDLFQRDFNFKNNLVVKIGVEHDFFSGAVLRVGFCHYGSPISVSLNRAWITAGTAYRKERFGVDFSVAFTNGNYTYPDLFPVKGQERVSEDTVRETTLIGKVSFMYCF